MHQRLFLIFLCFLFPSLVAARVQIYYDYKKIEADSCGGKIRFSILGTNYDPKNGGKFVRGAPYELYFIYESEDYFEKLFLRNINVKHLDNGKVFQLKNHVVASELYKGKHLALAAFGGKEAGIDTKYVDVELSAQLGFSGEGGEYCKISFVVEKKYKKFRVWRFWQRIMGI